MDDTSTATGRKNLGTSSQTGRIVVGNDRSETAIEALGWATVYADHRRLPLTVVHATDDAAASLVQCSRAASLLVVGTRGHGRVAGAWLGSVAFAVSARASCPVVVVRGDARQPGPDRPVIVGADGSPDSDTAVRFAAEVAAAAQAPLIVLTAYTSRGPLVWGPTTSRPVPSQGGPAFATAAEAEAGAVTAASASLAVGKQSTVPVHQQIAEGPVADVLATAAIGCGLLVVGSRGRGRAAGLILGSTSNAVISLSPCPVAILRT